MGHFFGIGKQDGVRAVSGGGIRALRARAWAAALAVILALLPCAGTAGHGATLNEQLLQAAGRGDLAAVNGLLARGAKINCTDENGWTPLIWAAYYGRDDALKLLLDSGADIHARGKGGETALMQSAAFGHLGAVQVLLDRGADPNVEDERGWTPLRCAAAERKVDVAESLKKHGGGLTLIIAAILGDIEDVRRLIDLGANVDERDQEGITPLIEAIRHQNGAVIEILLEHGANPNQADNGDNTALMMAALTGQAQVVRQLLVKGANVNATDAAGWPVLAYAKRSGDSEVLQLLVRAGARDDRGKQMPTSAGLVPPSPVIRHNGKILTGKMVAGTATRMSIEVSDRGLQVLSVEVRSTTRYVPFRRPAIGETVEVRFRERDGRRIADQVRIVTPQ